MARTKEDLAEIKKQRKDLLNLLLKKTGTKHSDLVTLIEEQFVSQNLDVLSSVEKKRFNMLIL